MSRIIDIFAAMRHLVPLLFCLLLAAACCSCTPGYEIIEHLPDLNVPRHGHALLYLNGELTVIGGHTTGFIPTATAEYLKDGKWHTVESLYPHDYAIVTTLPDGKVLVAGGMSESFGKGHSLGAELYDPSTHSFSPLPILDLARTRGSAAVLSDGAIVISGNWYGEDDIAAYSLKEGGSFVKKATQPRGNPHILPCAPDNALILSAFDTEGKPACPVIIDRLRGEPLADSLFLAWRPVSFEANYGPDCYSIGNPALGAHASLLHVIREEDGQSGIIKQTGEHFTLMETDIPIPMTGSGQEPILWGPLHTDKTTESAYLLGVASDKRHLYVAIIGYGEALKGEKAPVTLLEADDFMGGWDLYNTLLPGGRIAFAGGNTGDNYNPIGTAFILHTEPFKRNAALPKWPFLLLGTAICGLAIWLMLKKREQPETLPEPESQAPVPFKGADLASRISKLVEGKQLYLRKGLKVQDIATELGTNSTYVSACTNGQWGMSFPQYLSSLRIRYSQKLLREHPDMPMHQVADESGFSSEQSFFRSFKAATGQTPSEWRGHC